jgi:3-isopropylmalate dehydrogenase
MTETSDRGQLRTRPVRLVSFLHGSSPGPPPVTPGARPLIGVFEGAGIGPEVIGATLRVLAAVERTLDLKFEVQHLGLAGEMAAPSASQSLPDKVGAFCTEVFRRGGAMLSGPCGGRYVYELRRQFDLFCKFVPVQPSPELARAGRLAPEGLRGVDILIVRDNSGGVYQGHWSERVTPQGRAAEHSFSYREPEVRRIVEVAARAAAARRGGLHVIVKEGGVPSVTALWRDVAAAEARQHGVEAEFMNIDLAAYELIQNSKRFDVVVAPNLFGDVIADIAGVLVSSRGVTFSGNFDGHGRGVYQTNHGCAQDLAGTDIANPAGQIFSLAMLLRESFELQEAATLIEDSLAAVWRQGWRTTDVAEPGCRIVGTQALADTVVEQVLRGAEAPSAA